jgi:hypothetical protein
MNGIPCRVSPCSKSIYIAIPFYLRIELYKQLVHCKKETSLNQRQQEEEQEKNIECYVSNAFHFPFVQMTFLVTSAEFLFE